MVGDANFNNGNNANAAGQPQGQPGQPVQGQPPVQQPPVQQGQPLPQYPPQTPQGQPQQVQGQSVYMNSPYAGGNPSNATAKDPEKFYEKKQVSRRNWIVLGSAFVVFALFLIGVFIFLSSQDGGNEVQNNPAPIVDDAELDNAIDLSDDGEVVDESEGSSTGSELTCETAKTELTLKSACFTGKTAQFTFVRGSSVGIEDSLIVISDSTNEKRVYLTDHGNMLSIDSERTYTNTTTFSLSTSSQISFGPILESTSGFVYCSLSDPVSLTACA